MTMKPASILLALAALITPALAVDSHDHQPAVGPNGGRVVEMEGGHAEFFVQPDRKVRVTILDGANKPTAPGEQKVTAIAEAPSGKEKLAFSISDGAFVSETALPEGDGYRVVLQIRAAADAKPENTRIDLHTEICGECKHPEYACTCTGGGHEGHGH